MYITSARSRQTFKMYCMIMKLFLLNLCIAWIACDSEDKATKDKITGKDLVDMGRKFNKPLLKLFGHALMDMECRGQACSPWTEWSPCDIFVGQFGVKKRSRLCRDHGGCRTKARDVNETETGICQKHCPSDYDMINSFCLKLYGGVQKAKTDAESSCVSDSGHLVNINTAQKWAAVASLLETYKHSSYVHVDGQRRDNRSPWTFTYETDITGYTNWVSGEPENSNNQLCLLARKSSSMEGLYDGKCGANLKFVCEVI